jgi:hypothetical protein
LIAFFGASIIRNINDDSHHRQNSLTDNIHAFLRSLLTSIFAALTDIYSADMSLFTAYACSSEQISRRSSLAERPDRRRPDST